MPYKDLVSFVNSTLEVLSLVTMYMQHLRKDKALYPQYLIGGGCFRLATAT